MIKQKIKKSIRQQRIEDSDRWRKRWMLNNQKKWLRANKALTKIFNIDSECLEMERELKEERKYYNE